jgi:hypothetical protein
MAEQVIVVVASCTDAPAWGFARRYAAQGVYLLTPADLSHCGWYYRVGDIETSIAVIGGQRIAACDIRGVITRLPAVSEDDLEHIVALDRAYVAAEMQAFLFSWLTALRCPVLNRPAPSCLAGPAWRPAQWIRAAARLGLPVMTVVEQASFARTLSTSGTSRPKCVTVTVVGQRIIGTVDPLLAQQARALATAAGVDLLAVRFSRRASGATIVGAHLWPNIAAAPIAAAVFDYLHNAAPGEEQRDFPGGSATGRSSTCGA